MSKLPLVAIIGRPNTGKSTLFNRLVGKRVAIESHIPGTTRDHIVRKVTSPEVDYLLIDTGGMGGGTDDKDFEDDVHAQSTIALEAADLIVLTLDGRTDLTSSDHEIVDMLRKNRRHHVPVILAITKCDTASVASDVEHAFHKLGIADDVLTVSAAHNVGTDELEELIKKHLKKLHFTKDDIASSIPKDVDGLAEPAGSAEGLPLTRPPRVAIVGKPNVGKSSLINALMPEPMRKVSPKLVSDIPGTTRDATDTILHHEGEEYVIVDTAGLRRHAKVIEELEQLSNLRTIQAIEGADVAILLLDAHEIVSVQDKRIAGAVLERGKGLIIAVNKIDLLKGEERDEKIAETKANFPFCRFAPVIPVSAETRENLVKLFPMVRSIAAARLRRIADKDLRQFVKDSIGGAPMAALRTCKHVTQAEDPPPTFVLFVRRIRDVDITQLRYLENRFRSMFGFDGVPLRWILKSRQGY